MRELAFCSAFSFRVRGRRLSSIGQQVSVRIPPRPCLLAIPAAPIGLLMSLPIRSSSLSDNPPAARRLVASGPRTAQSPTGSEYAALRPHQPPHHWPPKKPSDEGAVKRFSELSSLGVSSPNPAAEATPPLIAGVLVHASLPNPRFLLPCCSLLLPLRRFSSCARFPQNLASQARDRSPPARLVPMTTTNQAGGRPCTRPEIRPTPSAFSLPLDTASLLQLGCASDWHMSDGQPVSQSRSLVEEHLTFLKGYPHGSCCRSTA
ncbi:hypothetical protein QBC47DRAFT_118964 [Echria macrotheca]|uniref:Uncharacterized protein n=1 Tax=Echria macrotheca TaxID=438768 RepID=A0AAJ0B2R4_9PEZI|nr:hypothetical protein QBC47DRAFT_118964 [Echria macrotheca]